jgi:hypothetical protein
MDTTTPEGVLRWLLDLELAGKLEGLTAVAVTDNGVPHYIALHNAAAPGVLHLKEGTNQ